MLKQDFDNFLSNATVPDNSLWAANLENQGDRTLLFGYKGLEVWHIYLKDGRLHRHVYTLTEKTIRHTRSLVLNSQDLIPDQLVPHRCDLEVCNLLRAQGFHLSFSEFKDEESEQFYGVVFQEGVDESAAV